MTNDTTNDQAVIGCILRSETPSVPSTETVCHTCGVELWTSNNAIEEMPDAWPMCLPCLGDSMRDGDDEILVLESTRKALHALGISDELIDHVKDQTGLVMALIRALEELP